MDALTHDLSIVLDVAEAVRLEQDIAASGVPLSTLMDRAGAALAAAVTGAVDPRSRIVILAGSGNNGGDGWVAAEVLSAAGYPIDLVCTRGPGEIRVQPAADAARRAEKALAVHQDCAIHVSPDEMRLAGLLEDAGAIVDCILGTGFDCRTVKQPYATWIELANRRHGPGGAFTVAADVPSGMSADTGDTADVCFVADRTVMMITAKTGVVEPSASSFTGELLVAPLSVTVTDYL